MPRVFEDRHDAGRALGQKLSDLTARDDVALFALPRGGVVVGAEVAKLLKLPLSVIITRKIGAPHNPEYALGALAESGDVIWNKAELLTKTPAQLEDEMCEAIAHEAAEITRRVLKFRGGRALPILTGKTVVLVDDGLATGLTMRAAIITARRYGATRIIVAVPHGAKESLDDFRRQDVEVVAVEEPVAYGAVGQLYRDFEQVEDEEAVRLLSLFGLRAC